MNIKQYIRPIGTAYGRLSDWVLARDSIVIFSLSLAIGIISSYTYYRLGLTLAYGDAESHINIAKRVVSSMTPGFGQLGGTWLPLHHILMAPLVVNDWLWRTGIGGSAVSTICMATSSVYIYKLTTHLAHGRTIGAIGSALFVLNPNILYMQATPMSELPLIASLVAATYYFERWANTRAIELLGCAALAGFAGTLLRYDAWFLVVYMILLIGIIGRVKHLRWSAIEGSVVLFGTLAFFGIALWLLWNSVIFHDPLYFMNSPYSAKSQQEAFLARGQLPSYHDMGISIAQYTVATYHNLGIILSILLCIGLVYVLFSRYKRSKHELLALSALLSPFAFNVISLYAGISVLIVPGMTFESLQHQIFNVRYGTMMIPAGAVFGALAFTALHKRAAYILLGAISIAYTYSLSVAHPITLVDAQAGLSSRRPGPVNSYIAQHYDYGYVIMDDFSRTANPVSLGIPMQQIIHVGNHPYWDKALQTPSNHVRWIIVRKDSNDVLWASMRDNADFLRNYRAVYQNDLTYVYRQASTSLNSGLHNNAPRSQ